MPIETIDETALSPFRFPGLDRQAAHRSYGWSYDFVKGRLDHGEPPPLWLLLSLGAPTTMRFRRRIGTRFERVGVPLPPRAAYHLSGEARDRWEHSVAAMEKTRWSITLRSLLARIA